jgi:D-alanine-D-alanine ligase
VSALTIAVIAGGPSPEAEVSRTSARGVSAALVRAGHSAPLIELDAQLPATLATRAFDVVFPVTHGPVGEDGCLQGLLEVLGAPYVGSGVLASALAASKPAAKVHFRAASLPLARDALVAGQRVTSELPHLFEQLGSRLVLKPASGGSAIGVEIIDRDMSPSTLQAAIERARQIEEELLVEAFTPGLEVTCGVLESERGAEALPPTWIKPKAAGHYDFVSKYQLGGSEHVCPAPFTAPLTARIQQAALAAHRALGCRDLSRVDFLVDPEHGEGSFVVLEVNTLPGMTATSLFPEAAQAAGITFEALCDGLARRAAARGPRRAIHGVPMP